MAGGWGGQRWGKKLTVGPTCRREGERGEVEWAGGCGWAGKEGWAAGGRGKMGQAGPRRVWAARKKEEKKGGREEGFDLFLFFQTLLNHFSKPFLKSNLLHKFLQTFHKPFSQLF
jgi:hypothetical protein